MAEIIDCQVTAFPDTDGGCQNNDPDLTVTRYLFTPGGGAVENITGNYLQKNNGYHSKKQEYYYNFGSFPDKLQILTWTIHIFKVFYHNISHFTIHVSLFSLSAAT